jgi:GNAT superfamily N-acetyltransferase
MPRISIRPAIADDAPLLLAFVLELGAFEKLSDEVVATEDRIRETLFGARPAALALLAEVDGAPAGFAIYFHNYSTFLARPGLYLEDLFVRPAFRRVGVGRALLAHLARVAIEHGCGRFEWAVLDWNQPAIDFYQSLGARPMNEWTVFRLTGEALRNLAGA